MLPNTQRPEKYVQADKLSVHSIFYTIQGEGPFCGTPAVFVRLAGCNLQCPACDTDYTSTRVELSAEEIVDIIIQKQSDSLKAGRKALVVITGGEPFRQDLNKLITVLISFDFYVQIETNGTLPPPVCATSFFNVDPGFRSGLYIVVSPKAGRVHPDTAQLACCYKYVMGFDSVDEEDGLPFLALNHSAHPRVARPPNNRPMEIYLQPRDDGPKRPMMNSRNLEECIKSCMKYGYTLQLQVHKIIGLE